MEKIVRKYNMLIHQYIHSVKINKPLLNEIVEELSLDFVENIYENIINIYVVLQKKLEKYPLITNKISLPKNKMINFRDKKAIEDLKKTFYGVSGEQKIIKEIIEIISKNSIYFEIVTINGSLADLSYRPGWSDIDIFIQISEKSFQSAEILKKSLDILKKISILMYGYNVLQFHGVFVSTPLNKNGHINSFFPIPVVYDGINLVWSEKVEFRSFEILNSDKAYYNDDIKRRYLDLRNKISVFEKTHFIHQIYSFPFAYLQSTGRSIGKKQSFQEILKNKELNFLNKTIETCIETYRDFKVKKIYTWKIRYFIYKYFPIKIISPVRCMKINYKLFIHLEPEIKKEINKSYLKIKANDEKLYNFIKGD